MTAPTDAMNPEDTLARWRAEEAAVRARFQTAPGVATPAQIAGRSGLQIFQGQPRFNHYNHYNHYNPMGTVHGGWFANLLDSAMGCALHSTLPVGKAYITLELKLNLVRALTDAVPLVRAEGQLAHGGRQVATAEGPLVGADGKLYAHESTTCLIFDLAS